MNVTAYQLAHQDPSNYGDANSSKAIYDDLMKPKEFARYRKIDPFSQTSGPFAKLKGSQPDMGHLERANRMKYGVKKPANVWRHEMDDSRISGF